jgi:glycosyltransferase involved in cell wall biosynthesis
MTVFSVIIPTKNRPDFLQEAVQSVLRQSLTELEVLVVNDGAPLDLGFLDPRIRCLENAERGAVPARNFGVARARGALIAFLDDDDQWIDPHFLRDAYNHMQQASFLFADGIMQFPGETEPRLFDQHADQFSLARDNTILISAVCYRKNLHDSLGAFDQSLPYYWDWDWYLRVARAGHALHHLKRAVVDIRIHAQNMSGNSNVAARQSNLDAFAKKHGLGKLTLKNHVDFV